MTYPQFRIQNDQFPAVWQDIIASAVTKQGTVNVILV